jgi:hypothetical protein
MGDEWRQLSRRAGVLGSFFGKATLTALIDLIFIIDPLS